MKSAFEVAAIRAGPRLRFARLGLADHIKNGSGCLRNCRDLEAATRTVSLTAGKDRQRGLPLCGSTPIATAPHIGLKSFGGNCRRSLHKAGSPVAISRIRIGDPRSSACIYPTTHTSNAINASVARKPVMKRRSMMRGRFTGRSPVRSLAGSGRLQSRRTWYAWSSVSRSPRRCRRTGASG